MMIFAPLAVREKLEREPLHRRIWRHP